MNSTTDNPYQSPSDSNRKQSESGSRMSLLEILVALVIVVILAALLLPAIQTSHTPSARTHCKNNLKQIALALHYYHDEYKSFPPALVLDSHGVPIHSWRVLILPFMDHQSLYEQYRLDEPWNSTHNLALQDQMPDEYRCWKFLKGVDRDSVEHQQLSRLSNYAAIVSPQSMFYRERCRNLQEVTDGTARTIMIAEVRQHAVHWMSPEDVTPNQLLTDLRRCAHEEHSNHQLGLHVGFVDGSVRWISNDLDADVVNALTTIDGGEPLPSEY